MQTGGEKKQVHAYIMLHQSGKEGVIIPIFQIECSGIAKGGGGYRN